MKNFRAIGRSSGSWGKDVCYMTAMTLMFHGTCLNAFSQFSVIGSMPHYQATLFSWSHKIIGAPSDRCAEACLLTWEYLEYLWALPYRASGAAHMEPAKCYEKSRIPWKFNKFKHPQEVSKDLKLEKIREQLLCTGLKCCKAAWSPPVNASIWCDCFSRLGTEGTWWFAYAS